MYRGVRRKPRGSVGICPILRAMTDGPVGKVGRVLVRIRGADSPGEVRVTVDGAPETYLAYCQEAVAVGADVLVISARPGRVLEVVPWEHALTIS